MGFGRIQWYLALLCNLVIAVWTLVAVFRPAFFRGDNGAPLFGARTFRYFTTDSNLLCALASLVMLPFCLKSAIEGRACAPEWAVCLKYVGVVSVMVTFLTVMAFLGPTQGYKNMFAGNGLFLHLIGPLLALTTFCALEHGVNIGWKHTPLGLLPTCIYGTVYLIMAVKIGAWDDFYGFNRGGYWPLSFLAMHACTYAISAGVMALRNLF